MSSTTSFTSTGNDACVRIQASLLNHTGGIIDARALTGSLTCTVNPMAGTDIGNGPGGQLWLGAATYNTSRAWTIPPAFRLIGLGKNNGGSGGTNTFIIASNSAGGTNWTDMYAAYNVTHTQVSTTAGTATFTDATTGVAFNSVISSAACDTGAFGHLVLSTPLTGLVEGDEITIQNLGSWNGNWPVIAVSGTSVEVEFQNTCSMPSGTGTSDIVTNNVVQAEWTAVATTGTLTTALAATPGGAAALRSRTLRPISPRMTLGVILLTVSGATYTISYFVDSQHVFISTATTSNPNWNAAGSKTCWVQGHIASTTPGTATQLNTTIGMQNTVLLNTSVAYWIGRPVVALAPFGGNHSSQGVGIQDVVFNGNNITIIGSASHEHPAERHGGG